MEKQREADIRSPYISHKAQWSSTSASCSWSYLAETQHVLGVVRWCGVEGNCYNFNKLGESPAGDNTLASPWVQHLTLLQTVRNLFGSQTASQEKERNGVVFYETCIIEKATVPKDFLCVVYNLFKAVHHTAVLLVHNSKLGFNF
ncbi:uncharacterized protein LJ206_015818 isoform 2-T2 [Theristicus caerulescens]